MLAWEKVQMNERQLLLDELRAVISKVSSRIATGRFLKESEGHLLEEALTNLQYAETYLSSYLQVDKYYGK